MKMTESQKVAAAAWRIRRYALQMGEVQGQGYIGQALARGRGLCHRGQAQCGQIHPAQPAGRI